MPLDEFTADLEFTEDPPPASPEPETLALFQSLTVVPDRIIVETSRELEEGLCRAQDELFNVLPLPHIDLNADEQAMITRQRMAGLLMGQAGVSAMRCVATCPFTAECDLFLIGRHPVGQLCPYEVDQIREHFLGWMRELNRTLETLLESERLTIGSFVSLQLDLYRVRKVLSRAQNAELNQVSVKDVNAQTGEPICWENAIHTAKEAENGILTQLRMLMKDYELTPESKTKRAKALGIRPGNTIATRQSEVFDRIKARNRKPIEITATSS